MNKENKPQKPHFNVLILTPGAAMVSAYVKSLLTTTHYLTSKGITWNFMNQYSSHVGDARERTIGGELYNQIDMRLPASGLCTYDKLFWIDSDIEWSPEDFMRLLNSPKHIISGVYQMDDDSVPVYKIPMGKPLHKNDIRTMKKPFQVRAVGFGFLAVAAGVYERMERPWFGSSPVEVENRETGEIKLVHPLMGEDTAWCEKAHQMGMQIWVDPLVRVGHQKTLRLRW